MRTLHLIIISFVIGYGRFAQAAVELIPCRIEETRGIALVEDHVSRTPPALKVTISLKGPEAESCVRYGDLKLEEAVDDQGTNLIPDKDPFKEAAKFKEYANAFFRKFDLDSKRQATAPQIELNLALPKRASTKIARLRGTVSLADQGTIKAIELPASHAAGPKKLDIPAEAHMEIVASFGADKNVRSIGVEITGDENALESIEVVDASGNKVSNGMSSWSINGGAAHKSIDLKKPLDDSMKLVAKIVVDRKIVKVPFDLKDITLP